MNLKQAIKSQNTAMITYKGQHYWVNAPKKEVEHFKGKWQFIKLESLRIIQKDDKYELQKEQIWFKTEAISEIRGFSQADISKIKKLKVIFEE